MNDLKRGLRLFARDMRSSVPLAITFVIAILAFVLALLVATGFTLPL